MRANDASLPNLAASDPGFPARRSCENDVGQAHTGAGGQAAIRCELPPKVEGSAQEFEAGQEGGGGLICPNNLDELTSN